MKSKSRRQCAKCPWKVGTDPRDIPDGYCEVKHAALARTIATPGAFLGTEMRVMACHESKFGREIPCAGWMANQLGPGNNIPLRLAVVTGKISADFRLVGPQHARFEDTLP